MESSRRALALAAVLAATVLTGGAAILGIVRAPAYHQPAVASVQATSPAAPATFDQEGVD